MVQPSGGSRIPFVQCHRGTFHEYYEDILNFYVNRSSNVSAESFNAKIKSFRAAPRSIVNEKFFLYRLSMIYAYFDSPLTLVLFTGTAASGPWFLFFSSFLPSFCHKSVIFDIFFLLLCFITQFCSSYGKIEHIRRPGSGADSRHVGPTRSSTARARPPRT